MWSLTASAAWRGVGLALPALAAPGCESFEAGSLEPGAGIPEEATVAVTAGAALPLETTLPETFARGCGERHGGLRELSCTSKMEREGRAFWLAGAGLESTALVWLTCAIASAIACSGD